MVELAAAYLDFAEGYYRKGGRITSQVHIVRQTLRQLRELYGSTPAADFGPLAIRGDSVAADRPGLARKTINHLVSTIKRVFKWGVSQELFP